MRGHSGGVSGDGSPRKSSWPRRADYWDLGDFGEGDSSWIRQGLAPGGLGKGQVTLFFPGRPLRAHVLRAKGKGWSRYPSCLRRRRRRVRTRRRRREGGSGAPRPRGCRPAVPRPAVSAVLHPREPRAASPPAKPPPRCLWPSPSPPPRTKGGPRMRPCPNSGSGTNGGPRMLPGPNSGLGGEANLIRFPQGAIWFRR